MKFCIAASARCISNIMKRGQNIYSERVKIVIFYARYSSDLLITHSVNPIHNLKYELGHWTKYILRQIRWALRDWGDICAKIRHTVLHKIWFIRCVEIALSVAVFHCHYNHQVLLFLRLPTRNGPMILNKSNFGSTEDL